MNNYSPSLFKPLNAVEKLPYREKARTDFAEAGDEITIKAVTHPEYRAELARKILSQATDEILLIREANR